MAKVDCENCVYYDDCKETYHKVQSPCGYKYCPAVGGYYDAETKRLLPNHTSAKVGKGWF